LIAIKWARQIEVQAFQAILMTAFEAPPFCNHRITPQEKAKRGIANRLCLLGVGWRPSS